MKYKLKTIREMDHEVFDSKVNEFTSQDNIGIYIIHFCSNTQNYVAHIQYTEAQPVYEFETRKNNVKPFSFVN